MLRRANIDTCKNIVREVTSLMSVDFIDEKFTLQASDDESARLYLTLLKQAVNEVMSDLYIYMPSLFQAQITLSNAVTSGDNFRFNTRDIPIFRIINIKRGTRELNSVINLTKLDAHSYLQQPLSFIVKHDGPLTITYYASDVFTKIIDGEVSRYFDFRDDEDYIIIDKWLIIYKMAFSLSKYKSLSNAGVYLEDYQKRINYLVSELNSHGGRVDLRG